MDDDIDLTDNRLPDLRETRASRTKQLTYIIIMPVWGDHHTELFLRYCIPFLLTDGNVGAFANRSLQVRVMSRRVDLDRMKKNFNYCVLADRVDLIETEIDEIIDLSVPHRAMTECYLKAVSELPDSDNTVTIFPTPDCILSRNALQQIVAHMESGWRAIMVCGLRMTLETAGPLLDELLGREGGAQSVSERELTAVVLRNLHPITLTCDVASDGFMEQWPSHVYWIDPNRRWLIAHCFHLHPLAVRGIPAKIDINTTIDGDYLIGLGVGADKLYVCADSDELLCAEISPEAKRITTTLGRFSKKALVRFSVSCNALHRAFYPHAIYWRTIGEPKIPDEILRETEEMNAAVARGSKYEVLRAKLIQVVRQTPVLLFVARCVIYVSIRARQRLGI